MNNDALKTLALTITLAALACSRRLRRRRGSRPAAAHGVLGPRGGARRAALRASSPRRRDRGRGALRRLGRARGDDRRGGRQLARRCLLRAGSGLARRGRRAARRAARTTPSSASPSASATPTAAGSAPPAGRACSSTTPSALSEDELPGSVLDLTSPKWKGRIGIAADQRVVPGVRDRDAPDRSATTRRARGSRG